MITRLKNHFIFSQGKIIEPEDLGIFSKTKLNISISLSSTYNDEEYYRIFIKNTLLILNIIVNRKYILEYFSAKLFKESQNILKSHKIFFQ